MYVSEGECKAYTTGFRRFAECLQHSAKPQIHSAKALPSAAFGKGHSGKKWPAKQPLPRAICRALGKAFAKCRDSTRQRKRAITAQETVTAALPSANPDGTRQSFSFFLNSLPSTARPGTRQSFLFLFFLILSLPSAARDGTRQSF